MDRSVKLSNTVIKDGVKKYIFVKEGVYFSLDEEQMEQMSELLNSLLARRNISLE